MLERPKRRKHKDNPYTLNITDDNKYIITFKNGIGVTVSIEIDKELFDSFDEFELEDKSQMNEYDRRIEHSELLDSTLYKRSTYEIESLEAQIIREYTFEELRNAIKQLPKVQARRIKKYYYEEKNERQIAEEENTSQQSVNKSIRNGLDNLKKFLKNKI